MKLSDQLAQYGRKEDHVSKGGMVAHISGKEAALLEELGGTGSTNPTTGLKEFYYGSFGDPSDSDAGIGYSLEDLYSGVAFQDPATQAALAEAAVQEAQAQAQAQADYNARDQEIQSKGLTGGVEEYNTLDPNTQAYVDSLEPGHQVPWWASDVKDEAFQLFNVFQSGAIQGIPGINQSQLDAITADAFRSGAIAAGSVDGDPYGNYLQGRQDVFSGQAQTLINELNQVPGASAFPQDLQAALGIGLPDVGVTDFTGTQSLIDELLSGNYKDVGSVANMLVNHAPEVLMAAIPGIGTANAVYSLLAELMGEKVVGTFTDPTTGILYSVTESGAVDPINVEDSPGYQFVEGDNEGRFPRLGAGASSETPILTGSGFDRGSALEELITRTIGSTTNPGIADEYFDSIIRQGIIGRNEALGEGVSQQQFEGEFGSSLLGSQLLEGESQRLRDEAANRLGRGFTGKAFEPITDDDAIANILNRQLNDASGTVANFSARGNLNATGGLTANEFLQNQIPTATARLEGIGSSVRGASQRDVDAIRDRALGDISNFSLGDELINLAPAFGERNDLIGERLPLLEESIRSQLGAEQLFDTRTALTKAAAGQGLVSGAPSFLDEIAAREGSDILRKRGVGSRGSGVF